MTLVYLLVAVLGLSAATGMAAPLRIGAVQIIDHPALDAARQGFMDALEDAGYVPGEGVLYDAHSAQGDMSIAMSIAQKFVSDRVDMVLSIATPTSQAVAHATVGTGIPVLITAVTDPVAAELVDSIEAPGGNVTGTSDLTPVAAQLRLLQRIAPEARRVGVVYNAGEINSVVQVNIAKSVAPELEMTVVEATAPDTGSVLMAAQSLIGRVDAIYVPTCNTAVAALESVIMVAENENLPLIVGEADSVRRGGLATVGIDYYLLGYQTGGMALEVLAGADPATMPIQYQDEAQLIVNLSAARAMGVALSDELLEDAFEVLDAAEE